MIKKIILQIFYNRIIRYIFFGGLTTFVNLISYFIFRNFINLSVNIANILSIITAIYFAYFVNSKFVFSKKISTIRIKLLELTKFVGGRIITMIIEVIGVYTLAEIILIDDMIAKMTTQLIVLVLNFIISKYIVFKS